MSAATASSTDRTTVYVRLRDEGTDVWRPVEARRLGRSIFRLSDAAVPPDEVWAFQLGDIVVAEPRHSASADQSQLIAIARASDLDLRSQTAQLSAS